MRTLREVSTGSCVSADVGKEWSDARHTEYSRGRVELFAVCCTDQNPFRAFRAWKM